MAEAKTKDRPAGAIIMARLIALVGSLAWVILLAVIGGVLGFLCAMGVTVFGAAGNRQAVGGGGGPELWPNHGLRPALRRASGALRLW